MNINELHTTTLSKIKNKGIGSKQTQYEAFFYLFSDFLETIGELGGAASYVHYTGDVKNMHRGNSTVHGVVYSEESEETDTGLLEIFVCSYDDDSAVTNLGSTDMERLFVEADRFVANSLENDTWRDNLVQPEVVTLADTIYKMNKNHSISQIVIHLLTNKPVLPKVKTNVTRERKPGLRNSAKTKNTKAIHDIPTKYKILDLERMLRFENSNTEREEMILDMERTYGAAIPAIPINQGNSKNGVSSYLCAIPGEQLFKIYQDHGDRLLESNVRLYLTNRTKVNQDILSTIQDEPDMFFAYNNGISATAESIKFENGYIQEITNLQIVNGGQTTSSIVRSQIENRKVTKTDRGIMADLSSLFVQMKITIVSEQADDGGKGTLIERIAERANNQNTIKKSDFFSNSEIHRLLEQHSSTILTKDLGQGETKWFYERMRGGYDRKLAEAEETARKTNSVIQHAINTFKAEYPPTQKVDKEDLSRAINIWDCKPHIVCKGKQQSLAEYMRVIQPKLATTSGKNEFNEYYFKESIAKSIVLKTSKDLIEGDTPHYVPGLGLSQPQTAYTLSKLSYEITKQGNILDLGKIWYEQSVPMPVQDAIISIFRQIKHIVNNAQLAKRETMWERVKSEPVELPDLHEYYISQNDYESEQAGAKKQARTDTQLLTEVAIYQVRDGYWKELAAWAHNRGLIEPPMMTLLTGISDGRMVPTSKQSKEIMAWHGGLENVPNDYLFETNQKT